MDPKSRKALYLTILGLAACALADFLAPRAHADHEKVVAIDRGTYIDVAVISPSSTSGTAIFSSSQKRPDAIFRNNSANTVWVGTISASWHNTTHGNILNGFPVLSSETFKLEGKFPGDTFYATCDQEKDSCEIRLLEGLNR